MFVLHSLPIAIFFCFITMLGWGSWANTQKLSGKDQWRFELYYWDYAIGVLLFGFVFASTFGSIGTAGQPALENFHQASQHAIHYALISGVIFNVSNLLLVVGIDAAGMAVAFPVGVGLALVIGVVSTYMVHPEGNPSVLTLGVVCLLVPHAIAATVRSARFFASREDCAKSVRTTPRVRPPLDVSLTAASPRPDPAVTPHAPETTRPGAR